MDQLGFPDVSTLVTWTAILPRGQLEVPARQKPPLRIQAGDPFMFWVLDGYFLSQERKFRSLYDHVRNLEERAINFSMDTEPFKSVSRNTWLGAMFSKTLLIYYGVLISTMFIVMRLLMH